MAFVGDGGGGGGGGGQATGASGEQVLKKRRVVNGKELLFRKPGEESDGEDGEEDVDNEDETGPQPAPVEDEQEPTFTPKVPVAKAPTIMIHEDD